LNGRQTPAVQMDRSDRLSGPLMCTGLKGHVSQMSELLHVDAV